MGCDIHAHIEYQEYASQGEHDWWGFAALQSEPRHYALFGALTDGEVRGETVPGAIAPRGYPTDAAWSTDDDYYEDASKGDIEPGLADTEAEKWRKELPETAIVNVHRYQSFSGGMGFPQDGTTDHTSLSARWPCPDWHTPSWLTTQEFHATLRKLEEYDRYWDAVLAAMEMLEAQHTPARLVFWFDN